MGELSSNNFCKMCRRDSFNLRLTDNGDDECNWSVDTTNLDECGYTVTLWAYDRTIVNSNGAIVHWSHKAVGFSVT